MRAFGRLDAGLAEDEGQMVVEMAVVTPVILVVALAVAPAGEATDAGQGRAMAAGLEESMAGIRGVEGSVRAESAWESAGEGVGFSFAPHLTRYVCTMTYSPWPAGFSVAGVGAGVPFALEHERVFVVDRYRSGVLF